MVDNLQNELRKILIKKAKGFYYKEETVEFTENMQAKIKRPRGRPRKSALKADTYLIEKEKCGVDLDCKRENANENKFENSVVKRKITTNYVPPDMLAIKMLFENFGEKIDLLENMSDEEILQMKKEILQEWREENEGCKS